jgi:hypothetical protein
MRSRGGKRRAIAAVEGVGWQPNYRLDHTVSGIFQSLASAGRIVRELPKPARNSLRGALADGNCTSARRFYSTSTLPRAGYQGESVDRDVSISPAVRRNFLSMTIR